MENMRKGKIYKRSYCDSCGDLVPFEIEEKTITENLRGKEVKFTFSFGICKECKGEVATDIYYNERRAKTKVMAYNALGGTQLRVD